MTNAYTNTVMQYSTSLIALINIFALTAAAQCAEYPDSLLGKYIAKKNNCFFGDDKDELVSCSKSVDVLTIVRNNEANFVYSGGHTCSFKGLGFWNGVDRVMVSNPKSGCQLALVFSSPTIRTDVFTPERCMTHCGMRGSLDSNMLTKVKSNH
jgi:hypothetical protein